MGMQIAVAIILNSRQISTNILHTYFACTAPLLWWLSPLFSNDMLKAALWPQNETSFSNSTLILQEALILCHKFSLQNALMMNSLKANTSGVSFLGSVNICYLTHYFIQRHVWFFLSQISWFEFDLYKISKQYIYSKYLWLIQRF